MSGVELFTIGSTAITLGDVGVVVGAVSSLAGASSQANALEFQAAVARQQAEAARQAAEANADAHRRQVSALAATQRARLAASGVDLTSGSALLIQEDLAGQGALDELTILAGGAAEAGRLESLALLRGAEASGARSAGAFGAASRLLDVGSSPARRLTNPTGAPDTGFARVVRTQSGTI